MFNILTVRETSDMSLGVSGHKTPVPSFHSVNIIDEAFDELDGEQSFIDIDGRFNPLFEASNAH